MKLGILGATFDPVHKAHIKMATYALDICEYILLLPTARPPHKDNDTITSNEQRYDMLCLSVIDKEHLIVSDMEYRRKGATYTVDSLRDIKTEYPSLDEIIYIIGADTLFQLETWKECEQVFKLTSFLLFNRAGFDENMITDKIKSLEQRYEARIIYDKRKVYDISSTDIRNKIASDDLSARFSLDEKVYRYIKDNELYLHK